MYINQITLVRAKRKIKETGLFLTKVFLLFQSLFCQLDRKKRCLDMFKDFPKNESLREKYNHFSEISKI